jgi:hypothetical protein
MSFCLSIDPPPDLVIEIEISRSVLDRMEIYVALGVPEVWRCDGRTLTVEILADDGYVESDRSPTFPNIPLAGIVDHLNLRTQTDETSIVRAFRGWVGRAIAAP